MRPLTTGSEFWRQILGDMAKPRVNKDGGRDAARKLPNDFELKTAVLVCIL